ncbi:MAG: PTS sugar transporter subunit IIC, partial [Treponema sp.]|nr:PTS sugar transporter subunit IIC [Treponema sp.]
ANPVFEFLISAGTFASNANVVGAAMAIGIGYAMGVPALVLFSLATVGSAANVTGNEGGPLAVLIIAIIAAEVGCLVSKKTKVDIIVTPLVTILTGTLFTVLTAKYIGQAASSVGNFVIWATTLKPFIMGIIVSVTIGIALTLPISSAAICAALGLTGLAGGAAVAGCCAQMVGFAVMSFKENRWGGILSQGLGTSMLQMPNIVKNPKIWIPPILASAITGPLATCLFKLEMNGAAVSSGMGTCGLVGQIGIITGWFQPSNGAAAITPTAMNWIGLILICFVLPAILSWGFGLILRKINWIKEGDLTLE